MKLAVEGMALEQEGLDGIKVVKGPMWKCGPGPPTTLRRHCTPMVQRKVLFKVRRDICAKQG